MGQNHFHDAETPTAVVYQLAGVASMCWENVKAAGIFQSDDAREYCSDAIARLREFGIEIEDYSSGTWRCPGCWERWPIKLECGNCGKNHPGLYRHPPVDPITGEVSAGDDSILMGELRHCDVPEKHRNADCLAVMNDHGYDDELGVLCPPNQL